MAYDLGKWEASPDCPYEFVFGVMSDLVVTFSRERICDGALALGVDYLCMIDDDMMAKDTGLWRTLLADLDQGCDVVAPLMFMRSPPHYPVYYSVRGDWEQGGKYRNYSTEIILNYPRETLFEVDAVGFGAVAMKTDVLRRTPKPWFNVLNCDVGTATGEDVYFCRKANELAGARIFGDSRAHLLHLGPRAYLGEREFLEHNPEINELREVMGEWSKVKAQQNLAA